MNLKDLQDLNDAQLLLFMKKGNELAFSVLYTRYWKRLYVYTSNILNDNVLAEDVLHEIFTKIWTKKEELEINSLENYLFISARNKSISLFRKVKFSELDDSIIESLALAPEVDHNLETLDLSNTLERITNSLPKRCKEIFYMSRYDDYTNEEIANHFNISQRTVENQLYLALKHIKGALKGGLTLILIYIILR
ncbi:RNA polymerase sigma factor [Formosa sp. 3Alg 14/1]|uniref:RNA polymerase sigma factor n=1 Tax=unclassified Formosa TaxID=2644710 RepID=UPI0039BDC634